MVRNAKRFGHAWVCLRVRWRHARGINHLGPNYLRRPLFSHHIPGVEHELRVAVESGVAELGECRGEEQYVVAAALLGRQRYRPHVRVIAAARSGDRQARAAVGDVGAARWKACIAAKKPRDTSPAF
jgi:hypothetical protein